MRFYEIIKEATLRGPVIDRKTGLYLNNKWSQSPYLGAVKMTQPNMYKAQIHIPQKIWRSVIGDFEGRWRSRNSTMPEGMFSEDQTQHPPIIISGFRDPRQAAWLAQQILTSPDIADIIEYILEGFYLEHMKIKDILQDYLRKMPIFKGSPLRLEDQKKWIKDNKEEENKAIRDENIKEFEKKIIPKIKQLYLQISKNKQNRKKIFKSNSMAWNDVPSAVELALEDRGFQHFLKGIHIKDPLTMDLSEFV